MPPAPTPALAPEPVHEPEPQDVGSEDEAVDEKLYCICKTQYDEDKVMIACDRCDEWYHTQCLKMAELEVDLVDQFICPICVQKNPHLSLQTTWKQRCAYGLQHADPASRAACHKPARGLYSKYCSDECGVKLMQARIQRWVHQGGSKDGLWEAVKHAQRREGVTLAVEPVKVEPEVKMEIDGAAPDADAKPKIDMGIQPKSATEREVERLRRQLDTLSKQHEEIQKSMDFIAWNERLLDLADRRSEAVGECGWDQRLCFGDSEWAEFGVGVLESYDTEGERQGMNGDAEHTPGLEGEWWCRGKTKCERHAGWQKLRFSEVALDKEIKEVALGKLTTREREIRKRIEDLLDPHAIPLAVPPRRSVAPSQPRPPPIELANGHVKTKANGQPTKRGKKRKAD